VADSFTVGVTKAKVIGARKAPGKIESAIIEAILPELLFLFII